MSTKYHPHKDELRLKGAIGALDEAQQLTRWVLDNGPCPLSESRTEDAATLARTASVLLDRLGATD